MTRDEVKVALEAGKTVTTGTLAADMYTPGKVTTVCPGGTECGCGDNHPSFEDFWESWGRQFELRGRIEE